MVNRKLKKAEGISWIGFGCIICVLASTFRLGSLYEPAPGFVAFMTGIFLCIIGGMMVLSRTFSRGEAESETDSVGAFRGVHWRRLTYTILFLFGYIFFLNTAGYIVTTFLLMSGLFYDWQRKNWGSSFLFSLLTVLISYLIFEVWLRCQLPRGLLPWW